MISDRDYIEDQLLDFIERIDPERVYVYEIAADLGGYAANDQFRFLELEERATNLLLAREPLERLQVRRSWVLYPGILGEWEIDFDLFLNS
ncbi:hypothetical protein ACXM1Q_005280 [Streptococcus sp. 10F2]